MSDGARHRVETALTAALMTEPGWRWAGLHLAGWLLSALLSDMALPSLSDDPFAAPGPMENLGAATTALALSSLVVPLSESLPWLETVSPRSRPRLRAVRLTWGLTGVAAGLGLSQLLMPPAVSLGLRLALVACLLALELCVLVLVGRLVAALCPLAAVLVCSVPGVVPWGLSPFNADVLAVSGPWAGGGALLAAVAWVCAGTRQAVP